MSLKTARTPRNLGEVLADRRKQALDAMGFKPVQPPKPVTVSEVRSEAAKQLKAQHYKGGVFGKRWDAGAERNVNAFLAKNITQAKVDGWNKTREGAPTELQAILDKYKPHVKY